MLKKLNKKRRGIYTSVELYACWCQCPYVCLCNCNTGSPTSSAMGTEKANASAIAGSNGDQVVANA